MIGRLLDPRPAQSLVEYAIGLNVLLLLTVGVVDLGRAVWVSNTLAHLAREGARHAVTPSQTTSQIQAYVVSRSALPGFSASNVGVTRGTCGVAGAPAVVTVSYPFEALTPLVSQLWGGGPLTLRASSRMYVERGVAGVGACP